MHLPAREWLAQAQRLPVGGSAKVRHLNEATKAMTVANLPDRWIAKCYRCNRGGVVLKQHATLSKQQPQERFMPWPEDAKPLVEWPMHVQEHLYAFMLSKGYDHQTMGWDVPLWYSEKQGRLLFGTKEGWLGRATGGQMPKWSGYGFPAPTYGATVNDQPARTVVLTEDLLSALKVRWAVRGELPATTAHAVLGTHLSDRHALELVRLQANVLIFLDGDAGGAKGNPRILRRVRGLGLHSQVKICPTGKDPKDLTKQEILQCLKT